MFTNPDLSYNHPFRLNSPAELYLCRKGSRRRRSAAAAWRGERLHPPSGCPWSQPAGQFFQKRWRPSPAQGRDYRQQATRLKLVPNCNWMGAAQAWMGSLSLVLEEWREFSDTPALNSSGSLKTTSSTATCSENLLPLSPTLLTDWDCGTAAPAL